MEKFHTKSKKTRRANHNSLDAAVFVDKAGQGYSYQWDIDYGKREQFGGGAEHPRL